MPAELTRDALRERAALDVADLLRRFPAGTTVSRLLATGGAIAIADAALAAVAEAGNLRSDPDSGLVVPVRALTRQAAALTDYGGDGMASACRDAAALLRALAEAGDG